VYQVPHKEANAELSGAAGELRTPSIEEIVQTDSGHKRKNDTEGPFAFRRIAVMDMCATGANRKYKAVHQEERPETSPQSDSGIR
jgi:hypothetical protein